MDPSPSPVSSVAAPPDPRGRRFRVLVARHQGMCFGVRDAIALVEGEVRHGPVTVLGQLAHNELVRSRLAALGAAEGKLDDAQAPTDTVVITAHGASDRARENWSRRGHRLLDTTCPLVRRAHDALATLVRAGFHPVVIGRRGHVEVEGLTGDFPGATVIGAEADLALLPPERPLGVVSQTTQPEARVRHLVEAIRRLDPARRVRHVDTVCRPTKDRQRALDELVEQCDFLVVVGGAASNNTAELVATARRRGCRAERVGAAADLDPAWFLGCGAVGVTAGTSTLPGAVDEVVKALEELASVPPPVG